MTFDLAIEAVVGSVPKTWRVEPFRRHATLVSETNLGRSMPLLSLASTGVIAPRTEDGGLGKQAPSESTIERYWIARPGNLVVNPMWLIGGGIGISRTTGAVSPDYRVYRLGPGLHPSYIHYLLRSSPYRDQYRLYTRADTTFDRRVSKENFHPMPLLIPPLEEQRRIAEFLDFETARIDRLSAAMRAQDEVLSDRRRAVLATTWQSGCRVVRLGYFLSLVTSGPRGWGEYVGDQGRVFFRSANLRRDSIEPNLDSIAHVAPPDSALSESLRSAVRLGDVLVGITGANTGWVCLANGDIEGANVSQHVCLMRPSRHISGRWLAYLLSSPVVQDSLLGSQYGGTKTQLSLPDLRDLKVPMPELRTQLAVANEIRHQIGAIESQRWARSRQLALLAERRQSVITAAVTGRLDVATARPAHDRNL